QGGHQPAALPVAARPAAGQARPGRPVLTRLGRRRAAQAGAAGARVQPAPGRGAGRGGRCRSLAGPRPGGMGGALMTVLVLVELDGGAPADASLRALTLARSLGDVNAVLFADPAPQDALASYGVTGAYPSDPSPL